MVYFGTGNYAAYLAKKRKRLLNNQFKDLLYSLSASFAAGRQMPEALSEGLENLRLVYDENSPLVIELSYIHKSMHESRKSEQELLLDLAKRSGCNDIRNFVEVYLTCRTTGGNIERVIVMASDVLMDKMTIEREIMTLTAQKRFEGKLISAMPISVIAFLNLVSPSYLENMYTTLTGGLIMTVGLIGIIFAYWLTAKFTEIEV